MVAAPNAKDPTAQLHEVQIVAITDQRLRQAALIRTMRRNVPPKIALTPPIANPPPMPVMKASLTQGLFGSSLKSSHVGIPLLNAFRNVTSGSLPPAVCSVPPPSMLAFCGGSVDAGSCLPPCHCVPLKGLFSGLTVSVSRLIGVSAEGGGCRVSSAIAGVKEKTRGNA